MHFRKKHGAKIWVVVSSAILSLAGLFAVLALLFRVAPESVISHLPFVTTRAETYSPEAILNMPTYKTKIDDGEGRKIPVTILMYHHVGGLPEGADGMRHDLTVSTEEFSTQVQWIKQQGYQNATLSDVNEAIATGTDLPKKSVIFTFDDGYSDVFINAVPVLEKFGYTGSFAIITNLPGTVKDGNEYASWDQIRDAKEQGMEIVCHTADHFDGSNAVKYNSDFIKNNLSECRNSLISHLGVDNHILVYPFGHYTAQYISIAEQLGYSLGLTTAYGQFVSEGKVMETPRVRVHGGSEGLTKLQKVLVGK